MEHIEAAGIHSGDSACVIPTYTISRPIIKTIEEHTRQLALSLNVIGLLNIQFAVKDEKVYVLEVNPRASRTVPFVSKTIGVPLAKLAARVMSGRKLKDLKPTPTDYKEYISIKEAVLPFGRFPESDTVLGPEMKSTGEVMGIDVTFGKAFAKAEMAAGSALPIQGNVFISVNDCDKADIVGMAKSLHEMGFRLCATEGTGAALEQAGLAVTKLKKVFEGSPNVVDLMKKEEVDLMINTPLGKGPRTDGYHIRTASSYYGVPLITTMSAAHAAIQGIEAMRNEEIGVKAIQDYHAGK
jgi:carbamoyl-phosphate synthase large subunit